MQCCPNPACPFVVRHGFAAEFEDRVERCRSCEAKLEQAPAPPARPPAGPALARVGVTVVLVAALLGFASVAVPGLGAGPDDELLDFAALSLLPGLRWLILASIVVELGALGFARGRELRARGDGRRTLQSIAWLLALAGLLLEAWWMHRSVDLDWLPGSSFGLLALARVAGLPLLLGLAAINDRWGLGHGIAVVLLALTLDTMASIIGVEPDWVRTGIVSAVLVVGAGVWLGVPARAGPSGRTRLDADTMRADHLGLTLTTPSAGLVAAALVILTPWLVPGLGTAAPLDAMLGLRFSLVHLLELAVVAGLTPFFAWAFTRPALLVTRWRAAFPAADSSALEREAQIVFRRALLRSELLGLGVVLLATLRLPVLDAIVLAAILLDLGQELRQRLDEPELVAEPTRLDLCGAESLALALRLRKLPAMVQGRQLRALFHLFGWWLPTRLLVRPSDVETAAQLREEILDKEPTSSDA